ncbi:MAG: crossover junction endodeoxyribonuclease RuvC [Candidatus Margulisiibacteriota bacterium]
MMILGIDPGYAITGVGIIETNGNKHRLVACDAIRTAADTPFEERLFSLSKGLTAFIGTHQPQVAAIEELFFSTNAKTAIAVGQARGVAVLSAIQSGLKVFSYTPLQVKSAICGYGKADKNQVQYMVKRLLNLQAAPKPDDVSDALAIAICHSHSARLKALT